MKVLSMNNQYATTVYEVVLGPEDEGKTDKELITCADNKGYDDLVPHHFGGTVERHGDNKATIRVWVD